MGWFKVDDQLAFHAKIVMAGNSAMGLWLRAGSWSAAHLTDGFIPTHMANAMANPMANPCDPDALVIANLWDEVEGGFQFHDWSEFQPSAAEEKARRDEIKAKRSEAGKKGAAARWQEGKPDGKTMANASEPDGKPMAPTRPDPNHKEKELLSEVADATPRPDVLSLLDLLDAQIKANGLKVPSRTKKNTDAIRLLMDRDGYTQEQVAWIIRWAAADEFWRTNILSASKLREKFTQLMAKAGVGSPKAGGPGFSGEIDVDAVLGKDYWMPPAPPEGLGIQEEIEWKRVKRTEHAAERLEQARKKLEGQDAATV